VATERAGVADAGLEALLARPREELREMARTLGLQRVSRLRKDELARRVHEALLASRDRAVPAAPAAPAEATPETAKLDLGAPAQAEEPPQDIPWSYGVDRVTAAAIDPDRLFVYWEVTESAIERARAALGPGGPGAWLDLRVYDTTGRLFDGTNAHGYLDHRVERGDRQWFFTIGKPTSTAVVEIGMMSSEGYFAKIARSGRVDFPRREPAPWREPEWMTVLATGEARYAGIGAPHPGPAQQPHVEGSGPPPAPPFPAWLLREPPHVLFRHLLEYGWERVEWQSLSGEGWAEISRRTEWTEPAVVTSWEAGPFTHPVRIDPPTREAWEGGALAYRIGDVTHVVSGPWQVVIRNLGAHTGRTVTGRWQVYRWRLVHEGGEVRTAPRPARAVGASEQLPAGASERRWFAGSELRLGGASELFRVGASEVLFRGASERLYAGASEWRLRGASERRLAGASEVRLVGASERRLAGASEVRLAGASERRLGGASERRLAGASEARLGGASERLGGSELRLEDRSSAPLAYPPVDGVLPAPTE
jgi:hypothetical protein